jgi:hypothetical protein
MFDTTLLRLKYISARNWRVLVPVLVVVSAVVFSGAAFGALAGDETTQRTIETDPVTVETTLSTEATVTGNTSLYETGETLTDMPVYLQSATPELTIVAETSTPADRTVALTQQILLELSATRNGAVFWEETQTLAIDSRNVTDGTIRTTVTVDVQELTRQRLATVTNEAGDVGTIRAELAAKTSYETGAYSGETDARTPMTITDRAYEVDTPRTDEQRNTTAVVESVPVTESSVGITGASIAVPEGVVGTSLVLTTRTLLGVVAAVTALLTAVAVLALVRRIDDFEAFQDRYTEARYSDWISQGKIPEAESYVNVQIETLVDVVDIAIDSQKRVIHDPTRDTYAVVDNDHLYQFRKDAGPGWMNEFGFPPIEQSNPSDPERSGTEDAGELSQSEEPEF